VREANAYISRCSDVELLALDIAGEKSVMSSNNPTPAPPLPPPPVQTSDAIDEADRTSLQHRSDIKRNAFITAIRMASRFIQRRIRRRE